MADSAASPRDPDVVSYGSFAGVRNDVSSERFGPADLDACDNVDIDNTGKLQRRAGYTKRNAVATHSLWSDGEALGFCVQGTTLKKIALDYALTTVRSGLTADFRMAYAKINGNVYFSNARETGVYTPSGARSWGLPVPPLPAVSVGYGGLKAGEYQFVLTYVRTDGQESGAGVAGRVTIPGSTPTTEHADLEPLNLGAGAIIFTLPVPTDTDIAYKNIYISPPNGDKLYLAMTVAAAATTATYAGTTQEFSYDLKTQFLQAPPAGHLVGYYSGRAYVAVDDTLFYSEPYAYELFDLRNYISMNGRITLIAPLEDKESLEAPGLNSGLFLGTDRNCGVLVGNSPETFQYVPKVDYGAIEGALDYVDGSLFSDGAFGARRLPMWLSTQGVCIGVPGMEIRNLTRNRFSFTAAGRGAAVFQPNPNRFVAISNF